MANSVIVIGFKLDYSTLWTHTYSGKYVCPDGHFFDEELDQLDPSSSECPECGKLLSKVPKERVPTKVFEAFAKKRKRSCDEIWMSWCCSETERIGIHPISGPDEREESVLGIAILEDDPQDGPRHGDVKVSSYSAESTLDIFQKVNTLAEDIGVEEDARLYFIVY